MREQRNFFYDFSRFFDAGREIVATYVCSTGRTSNANRRLPQPRHGSNSYTTDMRKEYRTMLYLAIMGYCSNMESDRYKRTESPYLRLANFLWRD